MNIQKIDDGLIGELDRSIGIASMFAQEFKWEDDEETEDLRRDYYDRLL